MKTLLALIITSVLFISVDALACSKWAVPVNAMVIVTATANANAVAKKATSVLAKNAINSYYSLCRGI